MGFPRIDGDVTEKEVPQALVSPVGLGLEQPVTFFLPNKNVRHIFMSTWAPHLLRLSAESNKDIFEIYARNSIIGRFSSYPGYYATGYTDLTYRADYPYKGPDINSFITTTFRHIWLLPLIFWLQKRFSGLKAASLSHGENKKALFGLTTGFMELAKELFLTIAV